MKNPPSKRHNFTNISDEDLEIGHGRRRMLGPLLFYRVLRTRELMRRTGYPHGIKSFRKLLAKLKKQELIGTISEDKFSQQYVYPREKLLRRSKGERWEKYSLHDESLETVKFYWKLAKIHQWLTARKENFQSESYINDGGPNFDFSFDMSFENTISFGMYAYFPPKGERDHFENIEDRVFKGWISIPIFFTRSWDKKLQRKLTKEHFQPPRMYEAAWCHLDDRRMTREEILAAPLETLKSSMTLEEFVMGGAHKIEKELGDRYAPKFEEEKKEDDPLTWKDVQEILVLVAFLAVIGLVFYGIWRGIF